MTRIAETRAMSHGFLLDGQWLSEGEALEVRSPFNHDLVGTTFQPQTSHIEMAIRTARAGLRSDSQTPILRAPARPAKRCAGHHRPPRGFRPDHRAGGRETHPHRPRRGQRAIFTFNIAAEESTRIYGEWLPLDLQAFAASRWAMVRRFPLGPIAAITPFNFPLNLVAHKWAPALAAGCTLVHKPASLPSVRSMRTGTPCSRSNCVCKRHLAQSKTPDRFFLFFFRSDVLVAFPCIFGLVPYDEMDACRAVDLLDKLGKPLQYIRLSLCVFHLLL